MEAGVDRERGRGFPAGGVFNAALDAVAVMSADGDVVDWNPAAERVFGYSYDDAIGRELATLIVPDGLRDRHRAALRAYLDTRKPTILDRRLELEAIRADGRTLPVELTVTRVPDVEPPLFAGFVRDLTSQRDSELHRRHLERRLGLLAAVGAALDQSLDLGERLQSLVDLAVPGLADLAVAAVVGDPGLSAGAAATAAVDPRRAATLEELGRRYPPLDDGNDSISRAVRAGESVLVSDVAAEDLQSMARDPAHLSMLERLDIRSAIVSPLVARRRVLGALALLRSSGPAYDESDRAFVDQLARRAALSFDNARLYDQTRHVAVTLQRNLLPAAIPEVPGARVAARYQAAGVAQLVGGDFYDCFRIGGDRWAVLIGDVCGKGPEAAAMTALARFTVRATAARHPDPEDVLAALNDAVLLDTGGGDRFLSVVYGLVRVQDGGLELCLGSGGHPRPLVVRRAGGARTVPTSGPLIGISHDVDYRSTEVRLERGDLLVLYTDGLTDAGAPGHIVGEEELERLVSEYAGDSAAVAAERLERAARIDGPPRDDVALVVVEASGVGGAPRRDGTAGPVAASEAPQRAATDESGEVHLLAPGPSSLAEARRLAREAAGGRMDVDQCAKLDLAVTEVVSNAIRHSGSDEPIRLALTGKPNYLCVRVTDHGHGLVPRPGAMASEPGAGFGLLLVEQLTGRWGMTRENDKTRIWFEIDYTTAQPAAEQPASHAAAD